MATATFLIIQALLVALAVVLLRPGADVLAQRVLGAEPGQGDQRRDLRRDLQRDLRLVGGIVVGAAVVLVTGVAVLVGVLHALPLLVVSVAAGAGAEVLSRRVDRPGTQATMMRWLERTLRRTQDLGRAGGEHASRLGRDVTSRARRAGAEPAAPRR